jgi:hypothetical protein
VGFILAAVLLAPPALILPFLDFLDRERNFTVGYICTARKNSFTAEAQRRGEEGKNKVKT